MVSISTEKIPNLISYKHYIRPTALRSLGFDNNSKEKTVHQVNVENLLKTLALKGELTTWEMAKIRFANDFAKVRTKEKEYRRLLIGRKDRGKKSPGLLDLGIVMIDSKSYKRNPGARYRLSLYGILFCFDSLNFSKSNNDKLAKIYATLLPKIFGKWDFLKSIICDNIYNIKWLGKGLYFENLENIDIRNKDFFELISYLYIKFSSNKEQFNEMTLSELISYWFFITLMYIPRLTDNKVKNSKLFLSLIFQKDEDLKIWFMDFVNEAELYYKTRYHTLRGFKVFA